MREDRVIPADKLIDGHALSFSDQPYFQRLIDICKEGRRNLVVLVGAGVSMDADLPSWAELIERLANEVVPEDKRKAFAAIESGSVERKTDTIFYHANPMPRRSGNETGTNEKVSSKVREALYGKDLDEPVPGIIGLAIARLIRTYRSRVSVVTTNFDEVLEKAMTEEGLDHVTSLSHSSWTEWLALDDKAHRASVMHLHGLIYPRDETPLGPLVLSETDFQKHGPRIRPDLADLLRDADVLIVGMSLTDGDITGPLSATRGSDRERFALVKPALSIPHITARQCAEAAVWQASTLQKALTVRPVLLKSYGQVAQVLTELSLAAHAPDRYRRRAKGLLAADSLHYGTRFKRTLHDVYRSLGAGGRPLEFTRQTAIALSRSLHDYTFARNGPANTLKSLSRYYPNDGDERIGVFLWLRDPVDDGSPKYRLRLVGTSVYVHWDQWSGRRYAPISQDASNAAAQAAYSGQSGFKAIALEQHSGQWQGAWGTPLIVTPSRAAAGEEIANLDQVQIGAIAVNTTKKVIPNGETDERELSVIARLLEEDMDRFVDSLDLMVEKLFL